jgi:hypothetical protein
VFTTEAVKWVRPADAWRHLGAQLAPTGQQLDADDLLHPPLLAGRPWGGNGAVLAFKHQCEYNATAAWQSSFFTTLEGLATRQQFH